MSRMRSSIGFLRGQTIHLPPAKACSQCGRTSGRFLPFQDTPRPARYKAAAFSRGRTDAEVHGAVSLFDLRQRADGEGPARAEEGGNGSLDGVVKEGRKGDRRPRRAARGRKGVE